MLLIKEGCGWMARCRENRHDLADIVVMVTVQVAKVTKDT